jgi:hypothetical protein
LVIQVGVKGFGLQVQIGRSPEIGMNFGNLGQCERAQTLLRK